MNAEHYCHSSTGTMAWDVSKETEPWWALVLCDQGIVDYYAWLCKRYGLFVQKGSAWGAHISFLKGEEPPNKELWGQDIGKISFQYSHLVRFDNDCHAWVDVWSDQLIALRASLGLPPKVKMSYHLTIGRLG